jgi:hypothetical protein
MVAFGVGERWFVVDVQVGELIAPVEQAAGIGGVRAAGERRTTPGHDVPLDEHADEVTPEGHPIPVVTSRRR